MAGKTAILSVRIVSDSKSGVAGLLATAKATKALEDAGRRARRGLGDLVSSTPKVAAAAAGITTLAAAGLAGTSNVLALAGAVTAAGGAALALPGILAGGAIAVGVLRAAFMDAETVLASTVTEFQGLQKVISGAYWAQAAQPIRDLATSAMPMLRNRAAEVATELGKVTAGIAETVGSARGLGQIETIFKYTRDAIREAGAGTKAMTSALLTLGLAGASYLPRLGQWFTDLSTRFEEFIFTAASDGSLHRWIEDGITALKEMGRIVGSVTGIFGSLIRAAQEAGGASLTAFADGLERVNVAMAGPAFQGALVTVFEGAHRAMENLTPGVHALGESFTILAPTISKVMDLASQAANSLMEGLATVLSSPELNDGAVRAFEGIKNGLDAMQPAWDALGPVVGQLLETFGTLVETVLPILATLFEELAPTIVLVLEALEPLIVALGENLAGAIEVVVPPLTNFAENVLPKVGESAEGLSQVIITFAILWAAKWTAMAAVATVNALKMAAAWFIALGPVGWAIAAVIAITAVIVMNWDTIMAKSEDMAIAVSSHVISGFQKLLDGVIPIVAEVVATVTNGWRLMENRTQSSAITMVSHTASAWSRIRSGASTAWAGIRSTVVNALSQMVSSVTNGGLRIISSMASAWSQARSSAATAWASIRSAVSSGVASVVSNVATLPGRIIGALAGMAGRMYSIGSQMMAGLRNGIVAWAGNIASAAAGVVGNAVSRAKSLLGIRSPSRVFRTIGIQTGQGLVMGLDAMGAKVQAATRSLIAIPSAMPMDPQMDLHYQGRGTTREVVIQNTIRVEGTVVDRLGTAEAIKSVLREHDTMMGVKS